jgi:hypothetical protein
MGQQAQWHFCENCSSMFFGGFFGGNPGSCVTGGGHDATGSFNFVLPHSDIFIQPEHRIDEGPELNPVDG